jgi:Ser/Thr protein kinase RdoA (MazF antagonist)
MPPDSMPGPPAEILGLLRAHAAADVCDEALSGTGAKPFAGGYRNAVYEWASPHGPVAIKIYRKDDRFLAEREWLSLTLLAEHRRGTTPAPLWTDPRHPQPAVGMTVMPGQPCPAGAGPVMIARAIIATMLEFAELPLHGQLAVMPRAKRPEHYVRSLTGKWASELGGSRRDALARDLLRLLGQWACGPDAAILAAPATRVFSHGDGNLDNWLWDGQQLRCIDFEFAGWSDTAFDLADLAEHVSARAISDTAWDAALADAGLRGSEMRRHAAARRTCALRWLAALWRQREHRQDEFETQLSRTRSLLRATQ